MWILNALLIHILLLGSIFVIYFRSPVLTGLQPQNALILEPPAKRLVLIVTDGLRAESFFRRNCSDIPNIRDMFIRNGIIGICHTRVPTESRPGHIALIAGLYEDPSAVTRGWKENPIDFDTLFNRSSKTYAWGANDVLHLFDRRAAGKEHIIVDAYDHELDFSGRHKTYELDEWVFDHVKLLLRRKSTELRKETKLVFFLHLLGLDSAGHIHKPGSDLFLENLLRTDRGIKEIYQTFEETFPDNKTAYILTSDHGMTNAGSHGAGDMLETETPFYMWGAGFRQNASPHVKKTLEVGKLILPLHDMEQAQMAPLMSALLGLPPPMNNFGILPSDFLNVSAEYEANVVHSNALQLLEQYQKLLDENKRGIFGNLLRHYKKVNQERINSYLESIDKYFKFKDYTTAKTASYTIMNDILEGIDYYHGYYRNALLLATTATFLGWLFYLLQLLLDNAGKKMVAAKPKMFFIFPLILVGIVFTIILIQLQNVPFAVAFYLMLPIFLWILLIPKMQRISLMKCSTFAIVQVVLWFLCAELLVYSFFDRKFISIGFLLFAIANSWRLFTLKDLKFYFWLILTITLAVFPVIPPSVGYTNSILLSFGILFTIARSFVTKAHVNLTNRLIGIAALVNGIICIYQHSNQIGIHLISQLISWGYLFYAFAAIIFNPTTVLKQRMELIFFNLTALYNLLCTSYESLFLLMLSTELMLSLSQRQLRSSLHIDIANPYMKDSKQLQQSFSFAFSILLYTFFSFFGTGNIASVSSFDPNIIRCFLTTFSPFIIMALVIVKLIIPVILNISIMLSLCSFARTNMRQIFISLLIICDVMGLNFLFLVRNRGSWLEIGSSISHFVIMEVTTLVLLLLTLFAKFFLRLNENAAFTIKFK